jgi:hypothetical protein
MKKKNPVAKNLNKFNKPKTFRDRKKEAKKKGYEKTSDKNPADEKNGN